MLDIPPEPIIENDVGIAAPPVEPPELAAAPGYGIIRTYPPVVSTITPRLAMTGRSRSSSSQTCKSKWNFRSGFIL